MIKTITKKMNGFSCHYKVKVVDGKHILLAAKMVYRPKIAA